MQNVSMPPQQVPLSRKGKVWRRQNVDFADSCLHFNYNLVRLSILHQKINYDLLNGKLHMDDLQLLCNPEGIKAGFIPDEIQHYPIMNSKLNVLKGEESKRVFDYRVVITNPNAISEIENTKKKQLFESLQQLIQDTSRSEEEFNSELEKLNDYYTYEYQDFREVRANCLLNHYSKEQNFGLTFNQGFTDAMAVAEEIYQCDIVGGEPVLEKLTTDKVHIFKSGYSNRIEDADMIVLHDYWPLGKIYDRYYDVLTPADIKYLETAPKQFGDGVVDSMDNRDERYGFVNSYMISDEIAESTMFFDPFGQYSSSAVNSLLPFDNNGNIRVLRVYWKSRRKIKKIKFYDPETGEEDFTFRAEQYVANTDMGEEEESFWINEAWEGTKIGESVYVNIRPRVVQYNTMSNPSRCHFGIVGSIYNINDDRPYSMVDMMKPYSYLYDIIHDRLNKMMARNWGKMTRLDLSKKPKSWKIEKWLYYAKAMGLYIEDSFNEGNIGAATGKLAGALNSNSQGVIDADFGNNIQQYINLLEFIKMEMSDVAGISKQREGQISNRETVGGVERATLQSSHITEWLFTVHEDVKRRTLEVFLETAKAALKGRNKKFQYILPDYSRIIMEIDGDEFAEADYGIVVDNSNMIQDLQQKLEGLAQAALQNQTLSFGTIMKLFMSASLAEKQRFVEADERRIKEEQQKAQQEQLQQQQQLAQMEQQTRQQEMQFKEQLNQRDNETKIAVAEINSQAEMAILQLKNRMTEMDQLEQDGINPDEYSQEAKDKLMEQMRQFDAKLKHDKDKLAFEKQKHKEDNELKERISNKQISARKNTSSK